MKPYKTLEFINDLKKEIQKLSEELSEIFPERIKKYSNTQLSLLWNMNKDYVNNNIIYKTRRKPDFIIPKVRIDQLKDILKDKFGSNASICIEIIKRYVNLTLTNFEFINLLKNELAKISRDIEVSNKELSLLLTGKKTFIVSLLSHELNPNSKKYNPNYKFSKERLKSFQFSLFNTFGSSAQNSIDLIKKYERLNPDLDDYTGQKYCISNPTYFSEIDTPEKSYWFGLLCADGWLTSSHPDKFDMLGIQLKSADNTLVYRFAKRVGVEPNKVKELTLTKSIFGNPVKEYKLTQLRFSCKTMTDDLKNLGLLRFKQKKILPKKIKLFIKKAKIECNNSKIHWYKTYHGKLALAWLLGFYDGDGTHKEGRTAIIYSSSRELLVVIKKEYEIPNRIYENSRSEYKFSGKNKISIMYALVLGPKLFEAILSSFEDSLDRKRLNRI